MEELTLIEQLAPWGQLGGVIVVVLLFLRHNREERKDREAGHVERNKQLQAIADKSNACHEKCAESMAASAEVIRQNTNALQRAQDRLDRLNGQGRTGDHRSGAAGN